MLLRFILWFVDADNHTGRDLLTIFAAFSSVNECFKKTDCPKGLDPRWKSKPAVKVETNNSTIQGSRNFILVASATGEDNKTTKEKIYSKRVFVYIGLAWKLKVANSSAADDINKTVVLTATISVSENTELRLFLRAAAAIKQIAKQESHSKFS